MRNRLEVVWKRLDLGLSDSKRSGKHSGIRDGRVAGIVRKWKYRTRKDANGPFSRTNRFLPDKMQKLIPLYVNMVDVASEELPGVRLRDLEALLDRCKRIQEGCAGALLDWDERWNNPLTLASKGWEFSSLGQTGKLICTCRCCRKTLCVDMKFDTESTESSRKSYWINGVINAHDRSCPWRENQFDLKKEYYLKESNLIWDITRMYRSLLNAPALRNEDVAGSYLATQQLTQLKRLFNCNDHSDALVVLLRGYYFIDREAKIVQCAGCFRKTFIENVWNSSKLNYHAKWCRYRQETELPFMILKSLRKESEDNSMTERLHNLETYLEDI